MESEQAIVVRGLRKSYDGLEAVKGIDFHVNAGEVFGLLGPNGAGKTTTVEILEGLRPRSAGDVTVLGFDPERQTLRLQLWEKKDAFYATLSGGQKQRLAIALALINDPQMLFLDEPTTGLDPQARLEIRDLIEELRAEKRTILMTTHYIEEAERLCDRVAIIDSGQIIAIGTPRELQQKAAEQSTIEITLAESLREEKLPLGADAETTIANDRKHVTVRSRQPARTLVDLVKWIDAEGYELVDVHLRRPTLEDVFIEMTGKKLRD
jgi:ABC-2 type transport system ATP-binding protein